MAGQAERKFIREQEQYRNLFIQKTGVKQEDLWQKIIYSPSNPDAVYANLYQAIVGQVADLLDAIGSDIESIQTALLGIRTVTALSDKDVDEQETQLTKLESQTNQANDEYTRIAGAAKSSYRKIDQFSA
ncbi:MAG: hypothetical protein IPK19_15245 [Chloroflexi bacterium]|nr:hypothetical protein [Chloroflexota bacterium]